MKLGACESMRSNIPPCPIIMAPVSLTPTSLLIDDSMRSPATPTIEMAAPNAKAQVGSISSCSKEDMPHDAAMAAIIPPKNPSQVFPGLMDGAILCEPMTLPTK